ncbi:MAG: hypothetical protein ACRYFB_05755 [Janthinobacterium lividum]
MTVRRIRENINIQILETEKLLSVVEHHPIMSFAYQQRLNDLRQELQGLQINSKEPVVTLLFSGGPVMGSTGIDASFLGKAILPFQKMVNANLAQKHGKVGTRGALKNVDDAKLFITALPRGSFGVELSKLTNNNLFDENQVSDSLVQISKLIDSSAKSDEDFAATLDDISQREFAGLRQFLKVVADDKAGVSIESGDIRSSLSIDDAQNAYFRVAAAKTNQKEIKIQGYLKGILLESWRFDFIDLNEQKYTGPISSALSEEQVSEYIREFFNKECVAKFKKTTVSLNNGRAKNNYILEGIESI